MGRRTASIQVQCAPKRSARRLPRRARDTFHNVSETFAPCRERVGFRPRTPPSPAFPPSGPSDLSPWNQRFAPSAPERRRGSGDALRRVRETLRKLPGTLRKLPRTLGAGLTAMRRLQNGRGGFQRRSGELESEPAGRSQRLRDAEKHSGSFRNVSGNFRNVSGNLRGTHESFRDGSIASAARPEPSGAVQIPSPGPFRTRRGASSASPALLEPPPAVALLPASFPAG